MLITSSREQLAAADLRTYHEYELVNNRGRPVKMMYHPDFGWGVYHQYDKDWERDYDMTPSEVADELDYGIWRQR